MSITYTPKTTSDDRLVLDLVDEKHNVIGSIVKLDGKKNFYPRTDEMSETEIRALFKGIMDFDELHKKSKA